MPPKEQLLANTVGAIQSPLYGIVGVLQSTFAIWFIHYRPYRIKKPHNSVYKSIVVKTHKIICLYKGGNFNDKGRNHFCY